MRFWLKPANSIVPSLGIGMHALSATIKANTPGRPSASMTSTAKLTSGSVMEASSSRRSRVAAAMSPVPLFATSLAAHHERLSEALARVVPTERFILGPEVDAFEEEFARYLGVSHCIGVANGTDALAIALRALGVERGDDVVVPSFTFYATAEAVAAIGGRPVFCDVDPETFCVTRETVSGPSRRPRRRSCRSTCSAT